MATREINEIPSANSKTYMSSGVYLNLIDLLSMISLISPFLIAFLMVMISVINSNIKGLIYLLGLVLLFGCVFLLQTTLQVRAPSTNKYCNMFRISEFSSPYFNSALHMYTIFYILFPMIQMGMINFPLIMVFSLLWILDTIIKYNNKCVGIGGIGWGSIIGIAFAFLWYLLIQSTGQKGLLYYDDLVSNKIACTRPTKQNFKCQVYKNGELIQNI